MWIWRKDLVENISWSDHDKWASTIYPPVANFLLCICAKKYENWLAIDKVIAKIIRLTFCPHCSLCVYHVLPTSEWNNNFDCTKHGTELLNIHHWKGPTGLKTTVVHPEGKGPCPQTHGRLKKSCEGCPHQATKLPKTATNCCQKGQLWQVLRQSCRFGQQFVAVFDNFFCLVWTGLESCCRLDSVFRRWQWLNLSRRSIIH